MKIGSFLQSAIPAAIFIALEGLYAAPVIAGDGAVVLQREVPVRHAIREGAPSRSTSIDASPDDKVRQAVSGQLKTVELGDHDFADVSTGTPQGLNMVTSTTSAFGLSNASLSADGLSSASRSSGAVHSLGSTVTGAVGGATGHMAGGVTAATGALSGLAGAVMRASGQ